MATANKVVEVVTDVPFSVPSEVGVIVDLPAKKFAANPLIALAVVTGVVAVGTAVIIYRAKAKKKAEEQEAFEAEMEQKAMVTEIDEQANKEMDGYANAAKVSPKNMPKAKPATDTPAL